MEPSLLQLVWFVIVGVLLTGYAVLDGFDLGVGVLALFARHDEERRLHMNAIGPVWDGNEVWLLTGGGALFAAFPPVYATVFSGFYLAIMLLLVFLIFRAVSFEFRSKVESRVWRRAWDLAFGFGSLGAALLLGVALGNLLRGVPLTEHGVYAGTFLDLLNPLALLVGVSGVAVFVLHGATYLRLKTAGELHERLGSVAQGAWMASVVLWLVTTFVGTVVSPWLFAGLTRTALAALALVATLAGFVVVPLALKAGREGRAFGASALVIVGLMGLVGIGLYPRLVPARDVLERSLTIANASSSPLALRVMLVIAVLGMPLVVVYSAFIHRVFRGKVVLGPDSY